MLSKARPRPGLEGDQALSSFRQLAFATEAQCALLVVVVLEAIPMKVGDEESDAYAGCITLCLPAW